MKRLAGLVLVVLLAACGDDPIAPPDPGFAPSVWTWSGPVELSTDLTVEGVELLIWEGETATARVAETENGFSHTFALWGTYTATENAVTFDDGPDPFPLANGERPTSDEIHSVLSWKGHDVTVVLTRVPGAVPE